MQNIILRIEIYFRLAPCLGDGHEAGVYDLCALAGLESHQEGGGDEGGTRELVGEGEVGGAGGVEGVAGGVDGGAGDGDWRVGKSVSGV